MEILKKQTHIDFLRYRWLWVGVSTILTVFSLYLWIHLGDSKFGVDFKGGSEFVVRFAEPVDIAKVRESTPSFAEM